MAKTKFVGSRLKRIGRVTKYCGIGFQTVLLQRGEHF
jgi:hypothetical protein